MFTIFHMKGKEAPQAFVTKLLYLLQYYKKQDQGQWLRSINTAGVKYCFCENMLGTSVLGAFSFLQQNIIYIQPAQSILHTLQKQKLDSFDVAILQNWAQLIAPTVIHQLRHKWQKARYGTILYTVLCFPIVRQLTIEIDADQIMKQSQQIIQAKLQNDTAVRRVMTRT